MLETCTLFRCVAGRWCPAISGTGLRINNQQFKQDVGSLEDKAVVCFEYLVGLSVVFNYVFGFF